ncbi:N-acetylmuramoyl-L-alanine amidase [Streptomyces sp. ISL-1]|uniref:peptidoglycan recognition protein family protein n=1 Tax=Streptomyces sp. ISL-1 TaxID=2817657 RepID=UPI001BE8632D|nr:peptidoglycan recognition protein [Streptomyces sp. ISL-1]MBT2392047.1 N-acetylmuramoyl-L-alanine amidase [Streptomyces sp. ISL-1]
MSPRKARTRTPLHRRRTTWLAAAAVALSGTGVTAIAVTGGAEGTDRVDGARPAKAHTLALDGKDPKKRTLPRTETQSFSLVGVSWEDEADGFEGTAQIRTRDASSGNWADWRDLDFDVRAPESTEGDATGVRGASEPLWVGTSDAVEARVVADGAETAVPEALRLDMIDPGETKARGNGKSSPKPRSTGTSGETAPSPSASTSDPAPTQEPTQDPTAPPPPVPSAPPSPSPDVSDVPTAAPSGPAPSGPAASEAPAEDPTTGPTDEPAPSGDPVPDPTVDPSDEPTATPSDPAPSQDPTEGPTTDPTAEPTDGPTQAPDPTQPPAPTAPEIVSRADWGADESLVLDPPTYLNKVDAVFVHHTAGTNDYACADSPAIIRAILTYHVKTNGWNDIGYNFFVDKCGTVFEGRAGGVDRPVLGAHTYGFNSYSSGVSVLGDYENGGTPTAEAKKAVAEITAWKLGLHGVNPQAKVTLTAAADTGVWKKGDAATLNTISGHRDGYATLCPGASLYSVLPEIRTAAGSSVYATH